MSATLVAALLAGPGLAAAGDRTRVIIGIDSGYLGLGLSYREGGYRTYPRYQERYRRGYDAPPPSYIYEQGYRDGYRDGRWTRHEHGPGRNQRGRGRWDRRYRW